MDADIDETSLPSEANKSIANLMVQSMLFDMEVDWETHTLIPKRKDVTPFWLKRWKDKEHEADRHPEDYEGGKDER